jgi:uncharacterized RDD family membrane protein YckC
VSGERREGDDVDELGRRMGLESDAPLWSGGDRSRDEAASEPEREREPDREEPVRWLPPVAGPAPTPDVDVPERDRAPSGALVSAVGWTPRVGAAVVDFFVRLAFVLAGILVGSIGFTGGASGGDAGVIAGAVAGGILGSVVYPVWMITTRNGQTIGHKASGTRIVRADGTPLTLWQAFAREVLAKTIVFEGIGGLVFWIPTVLNYLWPLWDEDNEALHDKVCKTRVVEA